MVVIVVAAVVVVVIAVVVVTVVVVVVAVMVTVWVIVVVAACIVFGLGLPPGSLVFFDLVMHHTTGTSGQAGHLEASGDILAKAGFLQLQFDGSMEGW